MKIAITADWHLRGKDLADARNVCAEFAAECSLRGVESVFHAGDVFDRPNIGDNHASTGAISALAIFHLRTLAANGIKSYLIPGNHDYRGAGSADALHVLEGIPDVTVWRKPGKHRIFAVGEPSPSVFALPWMWASKKSPAEILQGQTADILLSHIQVVGARVNSMFTCEEKPGTWQISRKDLEALPFRKIALGDFHARQELCPAGGYIGALRQLNFGEEGNPCGFEIWDSETNITDWVELQAPHYRTVSLEAGEPAPEPVPGEILRVRYAGEAINHADVRRLEAAGVQVEQIIEVKDRISRAEVPPGIIGDNHALVRLWAEQQSPPIENERIEELTTVFDEVFADKERLVSA